MAELIFEAPDGGVWEQDATHSPAPMSRIVQEASPPGIIKGISQGTAAYGLLLSHLAPTHIHGFSYLKPVIVGAPKNAKGPPPKFIFKLMCWLHPEIRRRLKTAATVLQRKPWREDLKHRDEVLKPTSTSKHLQLRSRDVAAMSDDELRAHLKACSQNLRDMFYQHHIYTLSCAMPMGDFMASAQEWTGLPPSEVAQAVRGSTPISTGVTDEYLAALRAIASDEAARAILDGPAAPADKLQALRGLDGATGQAMRSYLDVVSKRIVGGYDIYCMTAIERPEMLVLALRQSLPSQTGSGDDERVQQQVAKLRAAVPQEHRAQFDERLAEVRLVNRLRDERGYWSDLWATGIMRHAMLEAGRRLAMQGRVQHREHVLEARFDELMALMGDRAAGDAPSAAELAQQREQRVNMPRDIAPPSLNGTPSPPPPIEWFPPNTRRTMRALDVFMAHLFAPSDKASDSKTVRGIAVSAGTYEGRARVVTNIGDLDQLEQGDVLVTKSTSASFNYVLPIVGAIVTDRGGLMSHAAIVAREYGLPAVVGCMVATKTIPDGARVRVDADKGEVTLL